MALPTVDLTDVEILRTGGPYRGVGSPEDGDHITEEHLEAMARNFADLRGEVDAPNKLGHIANQRDVTGPEFLDGSGAPALGWLDNVRRDGDRLLADIKGVPEKFADLIRAGAYRKRSVEFLPTYTDRTGRAREWVLTGLAWLGARRPAVSGLADVHRLYAESLADEGVRAVIYEAAPAPAVVDEHPGGALDKALAQALGLPEDATSEQVAEALGKLVADSKTNAETVGTLRDELAAAKAKIDQLEAAKSDPGDDGDGEREPLAAGAIPAEVARQFEALAATNRDLTAKVEALSKRAEAGEDAARRLFESRRDEAITAALRAGKIDPAARDTWVRQYEADPDGTARLFEAMPVNPVLVERVGRIDRGQDNPEVEAEEKALRQFAHDTFGPEGLAAFEAMDKLTGKAA